MAYLLALTLFGLTPFLASSSATLSSARVLIAPSVLVKRCQHLSVTVSSLHKGETSQERPKPVYPVNALAISDRQERDREILGSDDRCT